MTSYRKGWPYPVAFPEQRPQTTLAETIAEAGGRQLHVAETEKYAHVTYFFNGGREEELEGEEHCLVESPRDVPTYDHKPEMSARAAADAFVEHWGEGDYRFGIINFANPDMVGHTGVIPAAVAGASRRSTPPRRRRRRGRARKGGACIVTADHGNCDHMLEPDGSPNTAHSLNPVPLIVTAGGPGAARRRHPRRRRPDRPDLLGIAQPEPMTGRTLIDVSARALSRLWRSIDQRRDEGRSGQTSLRDPARDGAARAGSIHTAARADRDAGLHPAGDQGDGAGAGLGRGRGARLPADPRQHVPPVRLAGTGADRRRRRACMAS